MVQASRAANSTSTLSMLSRSAVLRPFAISILAKARVACSAGPSEKQRRRILESISDDIRKCSNLFPHQASAAAIRKSRIIGIDLFKQDWHTQTQFDPGRKNFLTEHYEPVAGIRKRCLECRTVSAVVEVLIKRIQVVWILREEDERLTSLKLRINRPDPAGAYHKAGIRVVRSGSRSRKK